MKHKKKAVRKPAEEPRARENERVAIALRSGRLTRTQFQAWYERRRAEGAGTIVTLRGALGPAEPVGAAGGETFPPRASVPGRPRPSRRRRAAH